MATYYDSQGVEITCNSTPNYDSWGWDEYWSCTDWINYHRKLKECYGQDTANTMWVNALSQYSLFGHEWTCMNFDSGFIQYAQSQGIDANIFGTIYSGTGEVIQSTTSTAEFLSKLAKPAAIVFLIGGTIYLADKYQIGKRARRTFSRRR